MKDWYPEDRLMYLDDVFKKMKSGGFGSLSDEERKKLVDASEGLRKEKLAKSEPK